MNSTFRPGDVQRQIKQAADAEMRRLTSQLQRVLDSVHRSHSGQSVSAVKLALRSNVRRVRGASLDDKELTEFAKAISSAQPVKLNYRGIR